MANTKSKSSKVGGPEKTPNYVTSHDDNELLFIVNSYRTEAELARRNRMLQNKRNWNAYWGNQDFSHKQEGQSAEVLPKVSGAVEQFSAFVKRSLTQFGAWFSVDVPKNAPFTAEQARRFMSCYLDKCIVGPNKIAKFPTLISNALKSGLLESLIVIKIHGQKLEEPVYSTPEGKDTPQASTRSSWRLRLDLVPNEDYFPDPTGRGLYEIHRVERDLVDIQSLAEQGIYDKEVVNAIVEDFTRTDADRRLDQDRNQNQTIAPSFRKRIVVDECWGTLLNRDGTVLMKNALCAIANEKYVIRKPEPNPFWHGRSPLLAVPLVQVPYTVWGKALYDHAVELNTALNELYNLMLDGGIAEVWGIRQVRTHWLENPEQVSGGIPQGATLAVNENAPLEAKVVERIDSSGVVPQQAMNMFNTTDREFQAASLVNDIRLGFLPPRQVKATEVTESSNNSAVILDSFTSDIEHELIEKILSMTWMLLIQNMDDLAGDEVAEIFGQSGAVALARMSKSERHQLFGRGYGFETYGLSATLSRSRDFQKLMALMQAAGTNPMLMQAMMQKFSPAKILDFIIKALNINPESIETTPEEQAAMQERMQQMMQMSQITNGAQNATPTGGQESTNGEIAQNAAPSGGPAA